MDHPAAPRRATLLLLCLALLGCLAPRARAAAPCPRPQSGAAIAAPPDLYSQGGILQLALDYQTTTDSSGRTLYCFQTPSGLESPTLHIWPGDTIQIALTNLLPAPSATSVGMAATSTGTCGAATMNPSSVNIHFHGMNVAPVCHQDEVINTLVNSGQTFRYVVKVPLNEPPGLYWYHPHVHGQSESAVLGGASGVIEVEGIQSLQPAVVGLPQRFLVLRDQVVPGIHYENEPGWDVSLNYVPIDYPDYHPAIIPIRAGAREFWRVVNAGADTIMDLALLYDGTAQPLQVVALDGVPTSSQDGTGQGHGLTVHHILIPPAGRAEFIITAPTTAVATALLVTNRVDTGPEGDNDLARPLALLSTTAPAPNLPPLASLTAPAHLQRFANLAQATVTATRQLYFSEVGGPSARHKTTGIAGPPDGAVAFYITVNGQTPTLFSPTNPPAIVTRQGAVEDWTIQNRAQENHEFHIHQIHFLLVARDGKAVPVEQRQMLDTVNIPYWSGTGPYPSVTVRMDFRGKVVGDFVYHCHILEHEDGGMMAIIRVLPKAS